MSAKTIVILGGGIGGIVAARRLRRLLGPTHRIVLVERETRHLFQPSLLWLMTGQRTPTGITRPLSALARQGIEVLQGEIKRIDPAQRSVQVAGATLTGDYLVLALGAELAPETVPGLAAAGHNFYTLAGAKSLRDARLALIRGRVALLVSGMPFKCPAAPYEAAMLLEADFRARGLGAAVRFDIYTPEPGPMSTAGPEVSQQLRQMIEGRGIGYHPGHAITRVDTDGQRLAFANGTSAEFDLLAYVPPHRAPAVVSAAGLCGESGWVPVDRATLQTKFPGVYAIGDVTGIPLKIGKPLPKAGVFAHQGAEVVAHNIAAQITGRGRARQFSGQGACFVEIGDGCAGFGSGDFFAEPAPQMRLRHFGKVFYEKYWLWHAF